MRKNLSKTILKKGVLDIEEKLNNINHVVEEQMEILEDAFNFACYARMWFANGSIEDKRRILETLGSNLTLKEKKLLIYVRNPFIIIGQGVAVSPELGFAFEPKKKLVYMREKEPLGLQIPRRLRD